VSTNMAVGQSRKELDECKAALDEKPEDFTAHSNYGWAAMGAGEFQLALQQFSRARDLTQDNASTFQLIDLSWGL
jgi:Flp pilus assembly protein TadD